MGDRAVVESGSSEPTVVVAVVAVRVMEVPVDQVVDVVAVRHGLVPAAGAVGVGGVVSFAGVTRRTVRRVGLVDLEAVLVDVVAVGMMQVAVVQVVDVPFVIDADVAALGAVGVVVVGVGRAVILRHVRVPP